MVNSLQLYVCACLQPKRQRRFSSQAVVTDVGSSESGLPVDVEGISSSPGKQSIHLSQSMNVSQSATGACFTENAMPSSKRRRIAPAGTFVYVCSFKIFLLLVDEIGLLCVNMA